MGLEPFNVVAALNCVVAQRLMKKICEKCRVPDEQITPEALETLGIPKEFAAKVKAFKGKGCPNCNGTGGKGRIAIHEVLKMTDPVRRAIVEKASPLIIKEVAMAEGMRTLRQAALYKMAQGIVSATEVTKVTTSDTSTNTTSSDDDVVPAA
jgi:type IV pilus assembly protein PilB